MTVAFGTHVSLMDNDITGIKNAGFNSTTWTTSIADISVITPVQFDAWNYSLCRSAEYLFQFSQVTNFYQCRMVAIHNGTDIGISEYSQVGIGNDIPYQIDAAFNSPNVEFTVTCSTANLNAVSLKFSRVLFDM